MKDGVSKMKCERWCLTKWCKRWGVKDGVCDKMAGEK